MITFPELDQFITELEELDITMKFTQCYSTMSELAAIAKRHEQRIIKLKELLEEAEELLECPNDMQLADWKARMENLKL